MKTLIKNGLIVLENETMKGDILVNGETIDKIAPSIDVPADKVIDASGKVVVPGGIDVHTHFNLDVGSIATDDFETGTKAAAFGGTTMIVDHMGFGPKGCDLHHQVNVYHGYSEGKCVIDFSFHGVFQDVDEAILDEVASMVDDGIPSFKIYLTYDYKIEDIDALKILKRLKDVGGITTVHCENDAIVTYLKEKCIREGKLDTKYHPLCRPNICEAEAVNRMIALAEAAEDAPLYIVHVSCNESAELIKAAIEKGQYVYGETCPQYLFLDESKYDLPDHESLKYVISPPLRNKVHNELLWKKIQDGTLSVIATDHCPFDFHGDKQKGKDDFTKCPGGGPGVETRMPLIFSAGVSDGRISLNKFAHVTSTNPAKIFGLYPKKGVLAEGSDADIVFIDPEKEVTITKPILHENVDYTPYEGMKVKGWPVLTMVRGQVVVENNELQVDPGFGQFVKRGHTQKL